MKTKKPTLLLAVASLIFFGAGFSNLNAQSVSTDPVGYTTTNVPAGDDALFGISLTQGTELSGAASGVSGASFDVESTLTVDQFNNTHYVLATSGSNAGQWSEVVDTTTSSIETADSLLANDDTFLVIPFWTLSTLFVDGGGVGASADPFNPTGLVLLNDLAAVGENLSPAAAYFYSSTGPSGAGWYRNGDFQFSDDVAIAPGTYITVRNSTLESMSIIVSGVVPVDIVGSEIAGLSAQNQDNQVVNPYPTTLTLANSGLTDVVGAAADPFNPDDLVLVFDSEGSSGQNISPSNAYFYSAAGPSGAGWYRNGDFQFSNDVELPAGGAFIIRKGADSDQILSWNPPVPYSL